MVIMKSPIQDMTSSSTSINAQISQVPFTLVVEGIQRPTISSPEGVLVRVGAAGLCHSDLHLINGDWEQSLPLSLPKTPGHEIAGWIEEIGASVPDDTFQKGRFGSSFWRLGLRFVCLL